MITIGECSCKKIAMESKEHMFLKRKFAEGYSRIHLHNTCEDCDGPITVYEIPEEKAMEVLL